MSKTIREWANLCSDNTIRRQWIENANQRMNSRWARDVEMRSMADALNLSFGWDNSPQRHTYWENIYRDMRFNPDKYLKKRRVMFHEIKE